MEESFWVWVWVKVYALLSPAAISGIAILIACGSGTSVRITGVSTPSPLAGEGWGEGLISAAPAAPAPRAIVVNPAKAALINLLEGTPPPQKPYCARVSAVLWFLLHIFQS